MLFNVVIVFLAATGLLWYAVALIAWSITDQPTKAERNIQRFTSLFALGLGLISLIWVATSLQ